MAKRVKAGNQQERVERVAWELYDNLRLQGKRVSKNLVWKQAEKIVRNPLRTTLFAIHRPLIRLEKNAWEPLLTWANNQALLSLLGLIGNAGIILAVLTYIGTEKQRRDAEVLNAWQTITSAYGQSGSGGRIQALEFLNASPGANWRRKFPWFCAPHPLCTWKAEQLDGITLGAVPLDEVLVDENRSSVYLQGIQLPKASLFKADLSRSNLGQANLSGANLSGANFNRANLVRADLSGTVLSGADLSGADLSGADLSRADLSVIIMLSADPRIGTISRANLSRAVLNSADLLDANLSGADLSYAHLGGAILIDANLSRVNLNGAILNDAYFSGAILNDAYLSGGRGLTDEQLAQAKLCRTTLPDDSILNPNRDCEELGIDPETGELIKP